MESTHIPIKYIINHSYKSTLYAPFKNISCKITVEISTTM